jgi:hypothetical protein
MGKRLIRIFDKDIPALSESLVGMKLNLVLQNKSTFYGMLLSADQEGLKLKDMLNRKHSFKFPEITEIVYDKIAAY